jgi:hypothetical protein
MQKPPKPPQKPTSKKPTQPPAKRTPKRDGLAKFAASIRVM